MSILLNERRLTEERCGPEKWDRVTWYENKVKKNFFSCYFTPFPRKTFNLQILSLEIPVDFHCTLCYCFCWEGRNVKFTMDLLDSGWVDGLGSLEWGRRECNCYCVLAKYWFFSHTKKDKPQRQTEDEECMLTKVEMK